VLRQDELLVQQRLPSPQKDMPLRLLLLQEKRGELPWVVKTILEVMAPVDLVQVTGLGNAIWRLGHERFDSVLLDLGPLSRQAIDVVRRHIADVAAVPVLDLNEDQLMSPPPARPAPAHGPTPPPGRPGRPPRATRLAEAESQEMRWPPRTGSGARRKGARPRVRAPFLAIVD
jgi:hypothetical protein